MIKINKRFYYPTSTRKIIDGKRHYLVGEEKLPSVTRGKGLNPNRGTQNHNNFSIDRYDPRITYKQNNIIFCCFGCNDRKHNSNPDDWKNYLRIGKELINDRE